MKPITPRHTLCKDTGEVAFTYSEYLKTNHWRLLKERYKESNYIQVCAMCGRGRVEYHHRTYKNMGNENLNDIIPLCRKHHGECHCDKKVEAYIANMPRRMYSRKKKKRKKRKR